MKKMLKTIVEMRYNVHAGTKKMCSFYTMQVQIISLQQSSILSLFIFYFILMTETAEKSLHCMWYCIWSCIVRPRSRRSSWRLKPFKVFPTVKSFQFSHLIKHSWGRKEYCLVYIDKGTPPMRARWRMCSQNRKLLATEWPDGLHKARNII